MSKHFDNLVTQLDKLARHTRQGSFRTQQRYYETMLRFCRFLVGRYVEFTKQGQTPYQARKAVSKLLGQGRDDVTRIDLASLNEKNGADGK